MAKIICCDKCTSIDVKEIGEIKKDSYTTEEVGEGLCGTRKTEYINHCKVFKQYKCNNCGFEFEELDRSY